MAFPQFTNVAFHSAAAIPGAVDLVSVSSACPANERTRWQTLTRLVENALLAQADAIHLEPDDDCLRLRMRSPYSFSEERVENMTEYLSCLELLQEYLYKDTSPTPARRAWFSFTLPSGPRLMQLDVVPTSRGDTYRISLLHELKTPPPRLDALGLSRNQLIQLRELLKSDSGLVLLASERPQARAQTARAIAQELVTPERKIACIDTPGHPMLPRVTQLAMDNIVAPAQQQVWPALGELGCDAIVACHTHSDDMALHLNRLASESTLVAQGVGVGSAADALDYLIGLGVRSSAIARCLSAIVVQKSIQCLCQYCREPQAPDDQGTAWLAEHNPIKGNNINHWMRHRMQASFSTAKGCEKCHFTGHGRSLELFAIISPDDDIRDALYDNDIRFALNRLREIPVMHRDLQRLAQEGIISLAEAARIAPVS